MFGLKIFTKTKTKKFANDKDRKQYYAIQGYYKRTRQSSKSSIANIKPKSKNNSTR